MSAAPPRALVRLQQVIAGRRAVVLDAMHQAIDVATPGDLVVAMVYRMTRASESLAD